MKNIIACILLFTAISCNSKSEPQLTFTDSVNYSTVVSNSCLYKIYQEGDGSFRWEHQDTTCPNPIHKGFQSSRDIPGFHIVTLDDCIYGVYTKDSLAIVHSDHCPNQIHKPIKCPCCGGSGWPTYKSIGSVDTIASGEYRLK
jgi:hypothetical protein